MEIAYKTKFFSLVSLIFDSLCIVDKLFIRFSFPKMTHPNTKTVCTYKLKWN